MKHLFHAGKASLMRLQTTYTDSYRIHAPDEAIPLREKMPALNDLVRQGKVHYIGCSNFTS
jgi:aryl-alcohol dehydrogenase-like predicted oxidoreductase